MMSLVEARKNLQALYLEADSNLWEIKSLSTNSQTLLIENQLLRNELTNAILLENTQLVCESQKEMIANLRARIEYFQGHDAQPDKSVSSDSSNGKLVQLEQELIYTKTSLLDQLRELTLENEELEHRLMSANQQLLTETDSKTASSQAAPSYEVLSEQYRALRVERDGLRAHCERLTQQLRRVLLPREAPHLRTRTAPVVAPVAGPVVGPIVGPATGPIVGPAPVPAPALVPHAPLYHVPPHCPPAAAFDSAVPRVAFGRAIAIPPLQAPPCPSSTDDESATHARLS